MLSEISQTELDKYCMISLICGIQKIQQVSDYKNNNKKKQTHRYREKTVVTSGEREGESAIKGWELMGINYFA